MRLLSTLALALISLSVYAEPLKLDTEPGRISYSLGYKIGQSLKSQAADINSEIVKHGLDDALSGTTPRMSPEDIEKARLELSTHITAARQEEAKKAAQAKLAAGHAYLEQNRKKPGVVVLPSGVQYRVIKAGEVKKPVAEDKVTVNYRGTLIDGSEFDSSYRHNGPATFKLDAVIAGWKEGLQQMQAGGKYELFIPAELAYGDQGQLANETLVFEIELVSVEPNSAEKTSSLTQNAEPKH